jgi:hypothetical protein
MPDYSCYNTVVFVDTMVILECRLLTELPWEEIDCEGPILILVVPQVQSEVDKRKRDGRLGPRARAFNRTISPCAQSLTPVRIVEGLPIVDIDLAVCDRIDWDALGDVDPDDADTRIVAQIAHARGVSAGRRVLLSHDINPIATASRLGISTKKLPDSWLLPVEPSPHEKELQKLRQQVRDLRTSEPKLVPSLAFCVAIPFEVVSVAKLEGYDQLTVADGIVGRNPKPARSLSLPLALEYDSTFDDRYAKFRDVTVPRYAATLHENLERVFGQCPFSFTLQNDSDVSAENVVIEIKATAGKLQTRFILFPIFEPTPPKRRNPLTELSGLHRFPALPHQVGRHEFEFVEGGEETIEIHCQIFRQRHEWSFEGVAMIDPKASSPLSVEALVTASNMHGRASSVSTLEFEVGHVSVRDLIDIDSLVLRRDFQMAPALRDAIERSDFEWYALPEEDDDSDEA